MQDNFDDTRPSQPDRAESRPQKADTQPSPVFRPHMAGPGSNSQGQTRPVPANHAPGAAKGDTQPARTGGGPPFLGAGVSRPGEHRFASGSVPPGRTQLHATHLERNTPHRGGEPPRSGLSGRLARILEPRNRRRLILALAIVMLVAAGSGTGALAAYRSAMNTLHAQQGQAQIQALAEQVLLGIEDMQAGRYEIAQQRFEYVLDEDPNFPGAAEQLFQVKKILYATATPTPRPTQTAIPTATPTVTATPTRDPRPLEELAGQAEGALAAGDWNLAIETVGQLRNNDPAFAAARVDGILYLALRNRGLARILNQRDLGGGAYDLSLAERIGPLDGEATYARDMVRLYMYGSAFWEAYPEQAVFYFGQVAAGAPGLTDGTGWSAAARYRQSLIDYGDQLAAADDPCAAQEQYELALEWGSDGELLDKAEEAAYDCNPPTATPTETEVPTETSVPTAAPPTAEPTQEPTAEPTAEPTSEPTAEPTQEPTAGPTVEPTAEPTSGPTAEPTVEPTAEPTAEPTLEPTLEPTGEVTVAPTDEG